MQYFWADTHIAAGNQRTFPLLTFSSRLILRPLTAEITRSYAATTERRDVAHQIATFLANCGCHFTHLCQTDAHPLLLLLSRTWYMAGSSDQSRIRSSSDVAYYQGWQRCQSTLAFEEIKAAPPTESSDQADSSSSEPVTGASAYNA